MLQLMKGKFPANVILDNFKQLSRKCPKCGVIDRWLSSGCQECGANDVEYACDCGGIFDVREYCEYTATGIGTTKITEIISAYKCSRCNKTMLDSFWVEALEDFARSVPPDFYIISEVGIATPNFLEVIVDVHDGFEKIIKIKRQSCDVSISMGEPSSLFKESLNYVTSYDIDDYGHSLSPTLRIKPGPPYSPEQRKTIHLLLSRIRTQFVYPIKFWSVHFDADSEEHQEVICDLIRSLERWPLDRGREAIALANSISNNDEPGLFVNTFRLLELVLERTLDRDILKYRKNRTLVADAYLELVRTHNTDLKTKIRRRVDTLPEFPAEIMNALWRIMCPLRGFNRNEVYEKIAYFRNTHVHQPLRKNEPLMLPWEIPNYELFARLLLSLNIEFIKH